MKWLSEWPFLDLKKSSFLSPTEKLFDVFVCLIPAAVVKRVLWIDKSAEALFAWRECRAGQAADNISWGHESCASCRRSAARGRTQSIATEKKRTQGPKRKLARKVLPFTDTQEENVTIRRVNFLSVRKWKKKKIDQDDIDCGLTD